MGGVDRAAHTRPDSNVNERVVVVGAGVAGSAAAWRLAERGADVVLVDRFGAGHDRGASHGTSRIFRHAYPNLHYVRLAARALRGWTALAQLTGAHVVELTGAVDHGDPAALQPLSDALAAESVGSQLLDPVEAGRRWPGLRFDTQVLWHPSAGRVQADHAVTALQAAAAMSGAHVHRGRRVLGIEPDATGVRVQTDAGLLQADQVVVAAGAWTRALVADHLSYPLVRITQEQPAHFALLDNRLGLDWPSFIHHPGAEHGGPEIYGLHSSEGLKVGEHGTGPPVDPDARVAVDPALVDRLVDYVRHWIPGVDARSAAVLSCLYTTSPDHDFVIDRVERVTVAGGFSGHGFKFGPALGDLVADLVLDQRPAEPLFGLDRFRFPATGTTRR